MKNTKCLIALLCILTADVASAQVTISATGTSTGGGTVLNNSTGAVAHGQTFQTPDTTNVWLTSFNVVYGHYSGPTTSFNAYVMEWSTGTTRPTGATLYTSSLVTVPTSDPTTTTLTFNTGGILLDASKTYAIFSFADANSSGGTDLVYGVSNSAYAGGQGYYLGMAGMRPFSDLSTTSWTAWGSDETFSATFSAVPEPSTYAALAGIAALGVAVYRRRHKQAV